MEWATRGSLRTDVKHIGCDLRARVCELVERAVQVVPLHLHHMPSKPFMPGLDSLQVSGRL